MLSVAIEIPTDLRTRVKTLNNRRMSEFENDLQRLTFLKRTIALLSSMVDGGECHTARSKEMKNNAQQVILDMEANVVRTNASNCNIPLVVGSALNDDERVHYEALQDCCKKILKAVDSGKVPQRGIMGLRLLMPK